MYEYRCRLVRVVNGNTIEADIDLGFDIWTRQQIKLYGVGAANPQTSEKEVVEAERNRLKRLLPASFLVKTILNKRGKRGRVLGILMASCEDIQVNINEQLIAQGAPLLND